MFGLKNITVELKNIWGKKQKHLQAAREKRQFTCEEKVISVTLYLNETS